MIKLIESIMRALVLLNSLNSLRKRDKMLGKLRIYLFFPSCLINLIKKYFILCKSLSSSKKKNDLDPTVISSGFTIQRA